MIVLIEMKSQESPIDKVIGIVLRLLNLKKISYNATKNFVLVANIIQCDATPLAN